MIINYRIDPKDFYLMTGIRMLTEGIRNLEKEMFRLVLSVCILTTLQSCAPKDSCENFPKVLAEASRADVELFEISTWSGFEASFNEIKFCYSKQSYSIEKYEKVFEKLMRGDNGSYYLFYKFLGIEDYSIVFEANKNGKVKSVFTYSPIMGYLVPHAKS